MAELIALGVVVALGVAGMTYHTIYIIRRKGRERNQQSQSPIPATQPEQLHEPMRSSAQQFHCLPMLPLPIGTS